MISLLTDRDSLEVIGREGLDPECVANEDLRRVMVFSLDYFHQSGRVKAPTEAVLRIEFGDLFDDQEIDFDNVEETIEWALDDLKGTFVHKQVNAFNRELASAMSGADNASRVEVATRHAGDLVSLTMRLESKEVSVDLREGMTDRLLAYEARVLAGAAITGMCVDMDLIDTYTGGIRDGELAVVAAPAKAGKSFLLALVALGEFNRGRAVCLFTLENSVEMTLDRMACLALGINPLDWDRGIVSAEQMEQVHEWVVGTQSSDVPLWVLQPEPGRRGAAAMVREAQLRGADSLLIDQLTFVEVEDERVPRYLQIREVTHTLKTLISSGRDKMPCMLAHQINREGVKAADKAGYLEMYHLAEGSEVERTADWVFGLYRSKSDVSLGMAKFQTLASRRAALRSWELTWDIPRGILTANREKDFTAS